MPRKKNKYDALRETILADLENRDALKDIDTHLVDIYVRQCKLVDALQAEVDGNIITEGQRQDEPVANPALVRLPAAQSQLLALAKQLGIGPYGRKLTTGADQAKPKQNDNPAAKLRPISEMRKAK